MRAQIHHSISTEEKTLKKEDKNEEGNSPSQVKEPNNFNNNINNINNNNINNNSNNYDINNDINNINSNYNNALSFDKESRKTLITSIPKRTEAALESLKDTTKAKTEELSKKEKSYIIFLWITDNIEYDVESYYSGLSPDWTPEGVYHNGEGVYSGYARLYNNIADYLNLEEECATCYAKGVGYDQGPTMNESNHKNNAVRLNSQWFVKCYNEFYFLSNQELLITTHFPVEDKWKYILEEFLKWRRFDSDFYRLVFEKYTQNEGLIELKNKNQQNFIIYGKDMDKKSALCS